MLEALSFHHSTVKDTTQLTQEETMTKDNKPPAPFAHHHYHHYYHHHQHQLTPQPQPQPNPPPHYGTFQGVFNYTPPPPDLHPPFSFPHDHHPVLPPGPSAPPLPYYPHGYNDYLLQNVLDSRYCSPNAVNLRINMENLVTYDNGNGQVMFHMEKHFKHRRRRVLQDTSNKPICVLHKKKATLHGQWEGLNVDTSELRFIVKRPPKKPQGNIIVLDVFLSTNREKGVCMVKANAESKSCDIIVGKYTVATANMKCKDAMEVRVAGNVDCAFVVALIMIVDHKMINRFKKICKVTGYGVSTAALSLGITESMSGLT